MLEFNIHKAPPFILEKINNICTLLWKGKNQYEQVANRIKDKDLRNTILSLAQESNQYACELSSQIHTLGGVPDIEKITAAEAINENESEHDEKEILSICKKNENNMVGAYRDILNESFLYEGLRKMVRYQLNEMLCTFMQVKQLNGLKLH